MRRTLLFFIPTILILTLTLISCDGWNTSPDDSNDSDISESTTGVSTSPADSEDWLDSDSSQSAGDDSKGPAGETSDTKDARSAFTDTVYIKSADASDLPSFESIYKFMPDNSCTASINNYDGFWPDTFSYYIQADSDGNVEIIIDGSYHGYKPDGVLFIINLDGQIVFPTEYPSELIDDKAFNDIYEYHEIWNKEAYGNN